MRRSGSPAISVLMSVYNGEKYVARALMSLLAQTFTDFEVIMIDDGSTDDTAIIIDKIKDSRIVFIKQNNIGLTKTLNKALGLARGKWIARHDADDFSLSTRFEQQIAFLKINPGIGMVGSSCFIQPEKHGIINEIYIYPEVHDEIIAAFTTYNPFVHGSMMIQRELIVDNGGYDEQYRYVQDYELWSRLITKTKVHNLADPLYVRSIHKETSQAMVDKQPIFNKIRDGYVNDAFRSQLETDSTLKHIQSVSIYPAITLCNAWNKSLSRSLRRISNKAKKYELPWLSLRMQAAIYYPWVF